MSRYFRSYFFSFLIFAGLPLVSTACAGDSLHALPNQPPTAVISGERTVFVGQRSVFSGHASSDPNDDALEFSWDFGDGRSGTGEEAAHVFAEEGFFVVTLVVKDEWGAVDTAEVEVLASVNLPPEVRINAVNAALTNQPILMRGVAHDPEGMALTYSWTFGDVEEDQDGEEDQDVEDQGVVDTAEVEKTYTAAGEYTISLTVTDELGASSTAEHPIVLVHNPFAPGQVWEGTYMCPQGLTNLALRITGVDALGVVAVFDFFHELSGADGNYDLHGNFNPETSNIEFFPDSWNEQPTGYREVGMIGTVTDSSGEMTYHGDITDAGCGTFSVTLQEEP